MYKIRIIYCILVFFTFGCAKKNGDKMPGDEEVSKCQIQTFYFAYVIYGYQDSIIMTYNSLGNPVSGIRGNPDTGAPNFIFHYDNRNRLKELIGLFDTSNVESAEVWHNYSYDEYDRIIKDSSYYVPEVVNERPLEKNVVIVSYEYDPKNRINKTTTLFFGTTTIKNYTYDENGNRDRIGYDDKINFHRTNKIWMFLSRDYSMNNPANATYLYNDTNLPAQIVCDPGSNNEFFDFGFNSIGFDVASIKYNCR